MSNPEEFLRKMSELANILNADKDALIVLCKIEGFGSMISGISGTHANLVSSLANALHEQPELRRLIEDAMMVLVDENNRKKEEARKKEENKEENKEAEVDMEEWEKKLALTNMFGGHEQSD